MYFCWLFNIKISGLSWIQDIRNNRKEGKLEPRISAVKFYSHFICRNKLSTCMLLRCSHFQCTTGIKLVMHYSLPINTRFAFSLSHFNTVQFFKGKHNILIKIFQIVCQKIYVILTLMTVKEPRQNYTIEETFLKNSELR